MENPLVSVVINTHNRCSYLRNALLGLSGIKYDNFEVVVVNGPSTDSTETLLREWSGKIKHVQCDVLNLSVSRNIGIKNSSGDIIAFMDDDAVPHPYWISKLVEHYSNPKVSAVGGFTVDNTGVKWQVRKTICDRLGNAYNVSNFFDERPLSKKKSWFYPSLLGTNSSFRTSALRRIGGFDETFSYMLDETDVCLRLVDDGGLVIYEPEALIFHQFAPSAVRSKRKIARTLYPSAVSRGYFVYKHAACVDYDKAIGELNRFKDEILTANKWLCDHNEITNQHKFNLDEDLKTGLSHGMEKSFNSMQAPYNGGSLDPDTPRVEAKKFLPSKKIRIVLVSQGFPPETDAGIARWTFLAATGLAKLGHHVHVLTRSRDESESIVFENGVWIHKLFAKSKGPSVISEKYDIPENIADWSNRVFQEIKFVKSFGLDIISFPIWDLEAIPCIDDDVPVVVSLHTTYAMAKPFKPEWNIRPIYENLMVNRMISAEKKLLERIPNVLANSKSIIDSLNDVYSIDITEKSIIVPHGTEDLLQKNNFILDYTNPKKDSAMTVLYFGRFEMRKGFDIAIKVAESLKANKNIKFLFCGDELNASWKNKFNMEKIDVDNLKNIEWKGFLSRDDLDSVIFSSDIVLIPSRFESFGLVAIESFSLAKPVITIDVGGMGEVVEHDVDGYKFPDDENLVTNIKNKISLLSLNKEKISSLSRNAREKYEELYTIDKMVSGMSNMYQDTLLSKGIK